MPCTQILHEKSFFFALVIEKEEKGKESSNPHPYPRPLVPTMGLNALKEVLTLKVHTTSTPFPEPNACRQQEVACLGHISATRYIAQGTRCQWPLQRENCIFRPDTWKLEADMMTGPWELRPEW